MIDQDKPDTDQSLNKPTDDQTSICRDCTTQFDNQPKRCPQCGSPRLLAHKELNQLEIAHIDCDAFFASVEKRDNPELVNKPVIIGGGRRGVVATACYVARIRGVNSAMPMFKALQVCPDAVVISPNMEKYTKAGREIRQLMLELTPAIEPISIDEAFLDLSGTSRLHGAQPAKVLIDLIGRIKREVGVSVSVGLSYCKFLAKVASDLEKPHGFCVIGRKEAVSFLRKQPVSIIWGVGKVSQKMLADDGIRMIAAIQDMEETELMRRYGSLGVRLAQLSFGKDTRLVESSGGIKSVSTETTFLQDKSTLELLMPVLRKQSEKVAERLKAKNIAGQTIVLKLKTSNFRTRTRSYSLPDPTQLADKIYHHGLRMMKKEIDGSMFRLLGIGVSKLVPDEFADPHDLVDPHGDKRAKIERAVDKVRGKYGIDAVELGLTFKGGNRK